jgi:hypothetical protein
VLHSWRGGAIDTGDVVSLILLLLGDDRVARGASPESTPDQKIVQIGERRERHSRPAEAHAGTDDRVHDPSRRHQHHVGLGHDVDEAADRPIRASLDPKPPAIPRMPTVVDGHFLPDMGTMFG